MMDLVKDISLNSITTGYVGLTCKSSLQPAASILAPSSEYSVYVDILTKL